MKQHQASRLRAGTNEASITRPHRPNARVRRARSSNLLTQQHRACTAEVKVSVSLRGIRKPASGRLGPRVGLSLGTRPGFRRTTACRSEARDRGGRRSSPRCAAGPPSRATRVENDGLNWPHHRAGASASHRFHRVRRCDESARPTEQDFCYHADNSGSADCVEGPLAATKAGA